MYRHLTKYLKLAAAPICRQLPFFIFCSLALCLVSGINLHLNGMPTKDTIWGTVCGYVVGILWAYLFSALVMVCQKRWVKVALYILTCIYFLINLFLFYNYGTTVSPSILTVTAETNRQEATDFLTAFLLQKQSLTAYLISLGITLTAVVAETFHRLIARMMSHRISRAVAAIMALCVIAVGVPSACNIYVPLAQCKSPDDISQWRFNTYVRPADTCTDLIYSVYDIWLAAANTRHAVAANRSISGETVGCSETDSLTIAVVIGESYIKTHCQLYGYELATTPHLKNELDSGRLYVFSDAVSPYNMTSDVIKNVFSCNSMSHQERWYEKPTFPAIFRKCGYHVTFWDNQRLFDAQKEYTFALNSFLYNDEIVSDCYDETNKKTYKYDHQLVESFQKDAHHDHRHQLDIIHLMGQHFTASNRYPRGRQYSHFRSDSIRRTAPYLTRKVKYQISCYDNATYYNDDVMRKIIDFYKQKNAVVVYFADHGEEIYDYRDFKGREHGSLTPQALKYQFDVPFMIWTSDRYKATHPETCNDLAKALHRPMMIDNVCQILFRIGGVDTSFYQPQRDVTHPLYHPGKRLIRGQFYYEDMMSAQH